MNYPNSNNSLNRGYKNPMLQQSYSTYNPIQSNAHIPQMIPISQMSQFSQEFIDYNNNRHPYEQNSIRTINNNDSSEIIYKNNQNNYGGNMHQPPNMQNN